MINTEIQKKSETEAVSTYHYAYRYTLLMVHDVPHVYKFMFTDYYYYYYPFTM